MSLSVLCVSSAPAFNDYLDYLPDTLKDFVEDTWEDGAEALGELQEDVEQQVFSKTSKHFDNISEKMEKTITDLHGVVEKNDEICKDLQPAAGALIVLFIDNFSSPRGRIRYIRGRTEGAGREAQRD